MAMARVDGQSGGMLRGRRPKGQGPDLRQAILDAAEGLFSRHGFHGVTVRQVAAEACPAARTRVAKIEARIKACMNSLRETFSSQAR